MTNLVVGVILGLFVGAAVGFILAGLVNMNSQKDDKNEGN